MATPRKPAAKKTTKKKTAKKKTKAKVTTTGTGKKQRRMKANGEPDPRGRKKGKIARGKVTKPSAVSKSGQLESVGQPPYEPTDVDRHQVRALVGYGFKQDQIIQLIINPTTGNPISKQTLNRHFRREIDSGKVAASAQVAESLYKRAIDMHHPQGASCAMFWMKTQEGWVDKQEVEVTHGSGVLVVPSAMTPDQWVEEQRAKNAGRENPTGDE